MSKRVPCPTPSTKHYCGKVNSMRSSETHNEIAYARLGGSWRPWVSDPKDDDLRMLKVTGSEAQHQAIIDLLDTDHQVDAYMVVLENLTISNDDFTHLQLLVDAG